MPKKLKVLELFGGIGACSKALERLGIDYEIADYVEIDKYAVKSYNAIHNTNFEPQDITTWDKDIEVDLIMHGSPCQDFSLAGKQAGGDKDSGTRSSLMYETIRIVEKLKPKYVIWENVKNLLSKKHRHNFDAYLETMEQLGYVNYYQVLNAKDYGIPQNRERVFTVSILGNENYEFPNDGNESNLQDFLEQDVNIKTKPMCEKAFNKEYEQIITSDKDIYQCNVSSGYQDCKVGIKVSPTIRANNNCTHILQRFEFPPKQELKLKLKDMLEDEVDEKYYLSGKQLTYVLDMKDVALSSGRNINERVINPQIAKTISCRGAADQRADVTNFVINEVDEELKVKDVKLRIKEATKQGYKTVYEGDGVNISSRMKYQRCNVQKDMIQTLDTQCENSKGVVIKKDTNNYVEWEEKGKFDSDCRAYKEDKVSGAIMTTPKNKVLLKEKLCNNLIENGKVQEYDVIRHSYSNSRMKDWENRNIKKHNEVPTLDTRCDCLGVAVNQPPLRIRKLTPKETWRLMGFDDEDFEKASKVNSNTQLYKQAGNSIVVNVLEAIFKKLFGVIVNDKRGDK